MFERQYFRMVVVPEIQYSRKAVVVKYFVVGVVFELQVDSPVGSALHVVVAVAVWVAVEHCRTPMCCVKLEQPVLLLLLLLLLAV